MHRLRSVPLLGLLTFVTAVHAETKVVLPEVPDSDIENLVRVVAPAARCAAVSEDGAWLAFGHHAKHPGAQVSLFRLDKDGKPAATPIALKLPKPEGLSKYPSYALSVAFHPRLPLLYVWQDVSVPLNDQLVPLPLPAAEQAAIKALDHLLIYSLEKDEPELLVTLCREPEFPYSQLQGTIGIDPAGERLYVPNLRPMVARSKLTLVGSYVLTADGLPVVGEETPSDTRPRAERINAVKTALAAGKPVLPQRMAPFSGDAFTDLQRGSGFGYAHVARDIVLMGGYHCSVVITWDANNRAARLQGFQLGDESYRYYFVSGHPKLPVVYSTRIGTSFVFRFEHVDGHVTLVPRRAVFEKAFLFTAPVVMARRNQVAFGGRHRVYVARLNEKGDLQPERSQTLIGNQDVEALVYSEKWDRLYVGVEKGK